MSHRQRRVVPVGSSLRPRLFQRRRKYCRGLEAGHDIHGGHATPPKTGPCSVKQAQT